jgi:hypothetical protein
LSERYKPLFDDLNDHQLDSPSNHALLDEAAGKIRDPARLITLVREFMVGRMPEARYELVNLTVDGDTAAGVCLVVTRAGTEANPFAAEKIDGTWYACQVTPAALDKVTEYEANPIPATVKLPPRKEVRVTAEQLAAEFQSDPTGASRKYGSPFGPIGPMGPMGRMGPMGLGPPGLIIRPELPPKPPENDFLLEGKVAFRMTVANQPLVYLVTPAGLPAINMGPGEDNKLGALLAAAKPGQSVRAVIDSATLMTATMGAPATIGVSSHQIEIRGEPAEPLGPLAAADFVRELADPLAAARYQGRPVILTGPAVMSRPEGLMLGLGDGAGGMVGCRLEPSERKELEAVKRGQSVSVQGTYIQPQRGNQLMLHGAVLVSDR